MVNKKQNPVHIPILKIDDFLIVSLHGQFNDKSVLRLQDDIVKRVVRSKAKGVILDVSGLSVIDSFIARFIVQTAESSRTVGAKTVLTGILPEMAMTIVEFGLNFKKVLTALNLQKGIDLLRRNVLG
ncbi:MAG: STAS domain-containing protein [Candidatus Omnitrophica bacterium]|nr:STAS domain-containing protein [Candidatus Omnitrophota bacterium]